MCNFNKRIYATIESLQCSLLPEHSNIRLNSYSSILPAPFILKQTDIDLLKGTVSVISRDPPCKMTMSNLQRYPWNSNLMKNLEDTVVFWFENCFLKQEFESHFCREMKINVKKQQTWISDSRLIRQSF